MASPLTCARVRARCALGWAGIVLLGAMSTGFAWSSVFGPLTASLARSDSFFELQQAIAIPIANGVAAPVANELLSKPLFSPSRSKAVVAAPAEPVATPSAPPPPPTYSVGGVIISDRARKALLREQARDPGRWVSVGDPAGQGWVIESIEPNRVILSGHGGTFALHLYKSR
ncbi:MAG: hypothetical protein IT536_19355 [Hyphomicrobiales bacterium]|nr:hypothetical protein [Hyphomicrobiales bacterium]